MSDGEELPLKRNVQRSNSASSDGRLAALRGVPTAPLSPALHPPTDFFPTQTTSANGNLRFPLSPECVTSMRQKLLTHDRFFMKFLGTSKDTIAAKSSLQDLFTAYQTAFNTLVTGYLQVVEQLTTLDSCKSAVVTACKGITTNCARTVQDVADKMLKNQPPVSSFADKLKSTPVVKVTRGPSVSIPSNITFIVAPRPEFAENFDDFLKTKNALSKAVNPSDVDLKVERLTRTGGNEIRIEAKSVDLNKLRSLESLAAAGLHIKDDTKFNPRLEVSGIPKDMSKEAIREDFVNQNLQGVDNPDIKVVYQFPPLQNSLFTKCVLEVPHNIRTKLFEVNRIYLGFSACRFKDHVKIKHCYRCLGFGHLSKDCTAEVHCGHCGGSHEMRDCPNRSKDACCHNCKINKSSDTSHSALDGLKCPILKRRLTDKVRLTNYG